MGIIKEFKEFAVKGNMIDMAIGIIIGGAFGKIITSLVNDVIMPPLGALLGGINFTEFKFVLQAATTNAAGETIEAVTVNYGNFIQTSIDFLIVAIAIFMVIKAMNRMKKKEEVSVAPPPAPEPSVEEKLLTEIRDLIKKQ